jgi:broad specificity phosphatase PhoE/HEAT repeat protein
MLALLVASELQAAGAGVFLDVDERPASGLFPPRLESGIRDADVVVVLIGRTTLESTWVRREIELAHSFGKTMIPVFQEDFPLSDFTSPSTAVNLLMHCSGVRVFDRSNLYVHEALQQLAAMVIGSGLSSSSRESHSAEHLGAYRQHLIAELNNNLVLEIYERENLEDLCIAPLVRDVVGPSKATMSLRDLLGRHRLAVTGEPGSGKTTALRKLCLDLLRAEPTSMLPVYVSLASFDLDADGVGRDFARFLDQEVRLLGAESIEALAAAVPEGLLLALDGWDELHDSTAKAAIRRYLAVSSHASVITTRPEAQSTLPVSERVVMVPLDRPRVEEFLRLRLKSDLLVQRLLKWLAGRPDLQQLAENPLNLSLLAILFEEEGEDLRRVKRSRLFERAFETILSQHHRLHGYNDLRTSGEFTRYELQLVLETVAYTMSLAGRRFFSVGEFDRLAREALKSPPQDLSAVVSGTLGIIRDRRSGRLEFFHLWYQEFLAARRLIEIADADDLAHRLDDPKMAALLPFVVGLLDDPELADRVLREVQIPDLFNYCRGIGESECRPASVQAHIDRVIEYARCQQPAVPVRVELAPAVAQAGESAIDPLLALASDESRSDYARRTAIEALALLPVDKATYDALLVKLLETQQLGLLWHVVEKVGRVRAEGADPLLKHLLSHPDPIVVADATWALGRIVGPQSAPQVDEELVGRVIDCLQGDDMHRQGHALRTLGRLKVQSAIPYLIDHLMNPASGYRWIVPEAAALIGGPGVSEVLDVAISDPDTRVVAAGLVGCSTSSLILPDELIVKVQALTERTEWINSIQQTLGNAAVVALSADSRRRKAAASARLFLARHCETEWSTEGRLQGSVDTSLSVQGRQHARDLAEGMREIPVTRVFSSPLTRARQTAEAYAVVFDVPVTLVPGLRELDHGEWEGQLLADLEDDPSFQAWLADPANCLIPGSSESAMVAQQRAIEGLRTVRAAGAGETSLVVAHKHVLALLTCALDGLPLSSFRDVIRNDATPVELTVEQLDRVTGSQ